MVFLYQKRRVDKFSKKIVEKEVIPHPKFSLPTQNRKGHPVRAAYPLPVTVLCQNRLADVRTGKVAVKHLIDDIGNVGKDVSAVDKFVVKGGGRSNGKIIAFVPVPLRIHPVQGKGHNR